MLSKLHFSTILAGVLPAQLGHFRLPAADGIAAANAAAEALRHGNAVTAAENATETFGERLSKAVKAKLAARFPTQKEHRERAEKERARYRGYKRQRTKSE
jgi:hypothetical protein